MKIGNAFGGGMGLMGGTCGAVTGAYIILGLRFGAPDAGDKATRARTYDIIREFASRFEARNGSVVCRELLGFDVGSKEKAPDAGKIISEKCPGFVKDSVDILGDIIIEMEKERIPKGAE